MVYEKIATILSEQFDIDEKDLSLETSMEDIGADEVDLEDLTHTLEGEFDIELDQDEMAEVGTIEEIVDLINLALNAIEPSYEL